MAVTFLHWFYAGIGIVTYSCLIIVCVLMFCMITHVVCTRCYSLFSRHEELISEDNEAGYNDLELRELRSRSSNEVENNDGWRILENPCAEVY